jgi:ABC-type multidrug transport system fused ATPase/permease subunit
MVLELLSISLIAPLITVLINPSKFIDFKNFLGFNFFFKNNEISISLYFITLFLIFIFLRYLCGLIVELKIVKYTREIETYYIYKILDLQFNLPWKDLLISENSKITKLLLGDIGVYVNSGILTVLDLIKSFFTILVIFIFLTYIKGPISLLVLFFIIFLFLIIRPFFKEKLDKISKNYSSILQYRYEFIGQLISGAREMRILNLINFYTDKYNKNEQEFSRIEILRKFSTIFPKMSIELFILLSLVLYLIFNINNFENIIPFLAVLAFIIFRTQPLLNNILVSMTSLKMMQYQIIETQIILDKIITDNNKLIKNSSILETKQAVATIDKIELKNVSFNYHNNKQVFTDVNIRLDKGTIYGIKGKNGSGKSTLADLITGLLEPDKGLVYINDIEEKSSKLEWRSKIAYLSQSFFLFNDTIKNNITLKFKNQNEVDNELYNFAIKTTGLNLLFDTLINGDNTILLDLGKNLSGGQKQKIALARVLYKNLNCIIFDEATAHLDQSSLDDFCNIQKKIKNDKILINISHSESVLKICDKIFEIKNNKVILI